MQRHDTNEPDRRHMLELAKALNWPRVQLERLTTNPTRTRDTIGPGAVPWYGLAEQMPADVIRDAARALDAKANEPAGTSSPETASPADPLYTEAT